MEETNERPIGKRVRKKKRFKFLRKIKYDDILNISLGVVIGDIVFELLKHLVGL